MTSVSVVIPTWNEKEGIARTINDIPRDDLEREGHKLQILVVDGGSKDGTIELAKKAGAEVIIEVRPGYGRAYKTGFAAAKGDIIITADGDATYPMKEITNLVHMIENEKLDFITTNRFAMMEKGAMSIRNRLGNIVLSGETKFFFNLNIKDPESGMWVFKRDILGSLKLNSNNNTFSHEIKIEACYFGKHSWKEVPITYKARVGGLVKLTNSWNGWKAGFADLIHIAQKRLVR
jgi:dolichol-phosphate hexosyltransferase